MKTNRRELILKTAAELFMNKGYAGTSCRQIAEEVGCTEAAIYHHFKKGKRQLFEEFIENNIGDYVSLLDYCEGATSLSDLIRRYGRGLYELGEEHLSSYRWMVREFPNFNKLERELFYKTSLVYQNKLAKYIEPFVNGTREASAIAWILICATRGHRTLFNDLEIQSKADFPRLELIDRLAQAFGAAYP